MQRKRVYDLGLDSLIEEEPLQEVTLGRLNSIVEIARIRPWLLGWKPKSNIRILEAVGIIRRRFPAMRKKAGQHLHLNPPRSGGHLPKVHIVPDQPLVVPVRIVRPNKTRAFNTNASLIT